MLAAMAYSDECGVTASEESLSRAPKMYSLCCTHAQRKCQNNIYPRKKYFLK